MINKYNIYNKIYLKLGGKINYINFITFTSLGLY